MARRKDSVVHRAKPYLDLFATLSVIAIGVITIATYQIANTNKNQLPDVRTF